MQRGCFGASTALRAADWSAPADAAQAAHIDAFSSGSARSRDFSLAGLDAIDKTGVTQIRLRLNALHDEPGKCLFIKGGAQARLFVEYAAP